MGQVHVFFLFVFACKWPGCSISKKQNNTDKVAGIQSSIPATKWVVWVVEVTQVWFLFLKNIMLVLFGISPVLEKSQRGPGRNNWLMLKILEIIELQLFRCEYLLLCFAWFKSNLKVFRFWTMWADHYEQFEKQWALFSYYSLNNYSINKIWRQSTTKYQLQL